MRYPSLLEFVVSANHLEVQLGLPTFLKPNLSFFFFLSPFRYWPEPKYAYFCDIVGFLTYSLNASTTSCCVSDLHGGLNSVASFLSPLHSSLGSC